MKIKGLITIILIFTCTSLKGYEGDVTVNSRFLACGFDDGRQSDFEWVAPMFSSYGYHATFNIINRPSSTTSEYIQKVDNLIAQGHEIGDHTIWHKTFVYMHPFFNGQPEIGYVGGIYNKGFPSNADMREDIGDGKNVFGFLLCYKLVDSYYFNDLYSMGISDPDNVTWSTLTDADCQVIRDYYSVWNHSADMLQYLDDLSAQYCGTVGYSKDSTSWNGEQFTKGIFTGCSTTCNHEIWEREIEIQQQWFVEYFNEDSSPTNWSLPGGCAAGALLYYNGKRYHDRECTLLANNYAKCISSRTGEIRSWADILRANEYKTVSDALYEGRFDVAERRNILIEMPFNAILSKDDNICRLEYFDKISFAPQVVYSPDEEPLVSSYNWLKTVYEDDSTWLAKKFKNNIDKLVKYTTNRRIPFGLNDSQDTFTWRLYFDLFLQFCTEANIEVVSMKEAYDIAYNNSIEEGNLFRNPNMHRTVYEVIGADNSPEYPDGWSTGNVDTT